MKTLAASSVVLLTLCAPALADAPAEDLKIRFALRDTTTTHLDVIVGAATRCATASEKHADRELQLSVCLTDAAHVEVTWSTRSAWGEYHSTSSVPVAHGAVAELGSANGPRLTVTVQ
jgi:hypothetical protein